jgi:hypothetical protein
MNGTNVATGNVVAVLLSDGWHHVVQGSFSVGALDFGALAQPGDFGCPIDPGAPGFSFEEADHGSPYRPATLAGPLSSILVVRLVTSARATREPIRPADQALSPAAGPRTGGLRQEPFSTASPPSRVAS